MMPSAVADANIGSDAEALPTKDKVTIGLIVFFALVAFTLEAYFLIFNQTLEQRSDLFVKALSLYWPADYTYRISGFPLEKCFTFALESVNTCVTQLISFVLVYAILKRKPYRHALQLTVATYTFYGTFLYYYVAHLSGYKVFAYKGAYPYLMFYLANLPWFAAYLWMAWESYRAIVKKYQST
jgi:hypothetical protein